MAHMDASVSLPRPVLRSAAAAARAAVSGIASPTRAGSQVCVPSVAAGDARLFQQVIPVSQGESYESLMRLPRAVFAEKVKGGTYVDLQGFCKVVQVSAKGSRDDLEGRLIAFHNDFVGIGDSQMSQDLTMRLAPVPAMPSFEDPLMKSEPWKAFVEHP